ncbi:MAG: F0F1 ATP synthase subunit B [Puniceicoccales bacterium]|jgi:F-type H+-transporting ATPase subunit b|nr:F0F1 ATP synthase subunit B [Puniceicoccales bacterium]
MFFLRSSLFFAFDRQALLGLVERFGIRGDLLLLQSVNFVAMVAVLYIFAFRPVMRIMEERRKRIAVGLAQAEEAKGKLQEAEKLRQQMLKGAQCKAQQIVSGAKERAKTYALEQEKAAEARAKCLIEQAREVIAREKERLFEEVYRETRATIVSLAERVLAYDVNASEREKYIRSAEKFLMEELHDEDFAISSKNR